MWEHHTEGAHHHMSTITAENGVEYTVERRVDGDEKVREALPYVLRGKRGGAYQLMRSRTNRSHLFPLPLDVVRGSVESARRLGRFTDQGGRLLTVREHHRLKAAAAHRARLAEHGSGYATLAQAAERQSEVAAEDAAWLAAQVGDR
jgi:hypothetical protein